MPAINLLCVFESWLLTILSLLVALTNRLKNYKRINKGSGEIVEMTENKALSKEKEKK